MRNYLPWFVIWFVIAYYRIYIYVKQRVCGTEREYMRSVQKIAHSRDIDISEKGTVMISYLAISFFKLLYRNRV